MFVHRTPLSKLIHSTLIFDLPEGRIIVSREGGAIKVSIDLPEMEINQSLQPRDTPSVEVKRKMLMLK